MQCTKPSLARTLNDAKVHPYSIRHTLPMSQPSREITHPPGTWRGRCRGQPTRLLIVPGLHDSGPNHWQSWLQAHFRDSVRVQQAHWDVPDLDRWADRIAQTLSQAEAGPWVVAAHSFGCLALARYLLQHPAGAGGSLVQSALLVAPAEPAKFDVAALLPQQALPVPTVMLASGTDPWMTLESARLWARRWNTRCINLGDVGHINEEAGFGPLPQAKALVQALIQQVARQTRLNRAQPLEQSFTI